MKTVIAAACAAGAILATTSFASAQECRGGYRMLPNQVIIRCDDGPYYYRDAAPYYYEQPLYVAPRRVYVERRSYYEDRFPEGRYGYQPYYYDERPYHYRRHYAYDRNCLPFRALSQLIPGVAPPAC